MAGSRSFTNTCNGNHGSHYIQTLTVNWGHYDIENNRTYVSISYTRTTTNQSYWYNYGYANPSQISIDGSQVASATPYSAHNTQVTQTLCTWEGWVYHNDRGEKTINVSASFSSTSSNLSGGSVSGTVDLPTIPRASTIVVNDANIGSGTTISINKKSNSFTTELYWRVQGDNSWNYIATTGEPSYGWQVPTSLYSRIPNNRTIVCDFLARTLSGSTIVGDKTTSATFTAISTPQFNSYDVVDINEDTIALTNNYGVLVMYKSTAKLSFNVSRENSATISRVVVNGINTTYNSTSGNWELVIPNVTTNNFDVVAYDSRNYPNNISLTSTKIDYIPLTINSTINRNEPTDGKVNISINGNYFNDTFGLENNTLTVQYRYVEYGDDITQASWQSLTPTITNNTYSLTAQLSNFDYTKQYEFQVRAYDLLEEQQIIGIPVSKGIPTYNWGEDFFNINGELRIFNQAILTTLYPVGSIYMSVNNTNPSTYFGGTWVEWGSGRVPVGVNTNDSDFNIVEKTGGSKDLQQHQHNGLAWNGNQGESISLNNGSSTGYSLTYQSGLVSGQEQSIQTYPTGTGNSGNLQPYITCYMWKRTA